MDSLIFELQIVFYFQLFLSANVRHRNLDLERKQQQPSATELNGCSFGVFMKLASCVLGYDTL